MKLALILAFVVGAIFPATAQLQPRLPQGPLPSLLSEPPRTVPIKDLDGKHVGNATVAGNRITLRQLDGTLFGTVIFDADGTRTLYDASGNVKDRAKP